MASQQRLKIALIGLGRLGAIRARILAFQQPRIELVAACDTKPGSDKWAAENLPPSVKHFTDPEDCMKNSGAQAVLISTATATHAPLILLGLDLGLVGHNFDNFVGLRANTRPACHVREANLC
jgi:myo-inositol 2-dehydrogenase/D-chiro-inositol 1-dehydrogenase